MLNYGEIVTHDPHKRKDSSFLSSRKAVSTGEGTIDTGTKKKGAKTKGSSSRKEKEVKEKCNLDNEGVSWVWEKGEENGGDGKNTGIGNERTVDKIVEKNKQASDSKLS